ncbi:MAG: hypothetical protein HY808_10245 [Nitrospirae bacterium]|nr:hypothetical protein [Nitrospirota bacterium]
MKKYLVLAFSVMVVLAFAATSFALHQVTATEYSPSVVKAAKAQLTLGGELRIRGEVNKNLSDFDNDKRDTSQFYDQRARLNVKAQVSPDTFGFVELESGYDTADDSKVNNGKDNYTWGYGSNAKRGPMNIRQAYVATQGKGLGMLAGLKAGHMLLGLGNMLFFDHTKFGDDALLVWTSVGPGELSIIDIKVSEGKTTDKYHAHEPQADDADAYVVALEMPIDMINVSGDITYLRGRDQSIYDKGTNLINIGVRANADLKVVKVKGDIEVQTGTNKTASTSPTEIKHKGFAAMAGVEAPLGPVSVRGNAAYGSGDDDTTDNSDKSFNTLLSDQQYTTYIYDYKVKGAGSVNGTCANGTKSCGLNNTWYINAGVTAKPIEALKLSGDFYFLRAVKEVALNGNSDKSKQLGYEIDAKAEYQIDTNLVYFVEGGYLMAGKAYDTATEKSDNPYSVRHGLLLKF